MGWTWFCKSILSVGLQTLAYALSILNASKSEVPDDFAREWRKWVMKQDYIIVSSYCALTTNGNRLYCRNSEYNQ